MISNYLDYDYLQWSLDYHTPLGFGSSIFNFDQLPFLSPLSWEGGTYLFRKSNAMPIESKPETG